MGTMWGSIFPRPRLLAGKLIFEEKGGRDIRLTVTCGILWLSMHTKAHTLLFFI